MRNQPENGCLLLISACLLGIPCKPRGPWHATTMLLDSLGSYPEVLAVESGPTLGSAHVWSLGSSRGSARAAYALFRILAVSSTAGGYLPIQITPDAIIIIIIIIISSFLYTLTLFVIAVIIPLPF